MGTAEIGDYHFHMEDVLTKLCGKNLGIAPKSKVLYYKVSDEEECSLDVLNAERLIKCVKEQISTEECVKNL